MLQVKTSKMLLLGMDAENFERLKTGDTMRLSGKEMGIDFDIFIVYEDTLEKIADRFNLDNPEQFKDGAKKTINVTSKCSAELCIGNVVVSKFIVHRNSDEKYYVLPIMKIGDLWTTNFKIKNDMGEFETEQKALNAGIGWLEKFG